MGLDKMFFVITFLLCCYVTCMETEDNVIGLLKHIQSEYVKNGSDYFPLDP